MLNLICEKLNSEQKYFVMKLTMIIQWKSFNMNTLIVYKCSTRNHTAAVPIKYYVILNMIFNKKFFQHEKIFQSPQFRVTRFKMYNIYFSNQNIKKPSSEPSREDLAPLTNKHNIPVLLLLFESHLQTQHRLFGPWCVIQLTLQTRARERAKRAEKRRRHNYIIHSDENSLSSRIRILASIFQASTLQKHSWTTPHNGRLFRKRFRDLSTKFDRWLWRKQFDRTGDVWVILIDRSVEFAR